MQLSDEQSKVVQEAEQGSNILLLGKAGVGKSATVERLTDNNTLVTSTTGISALNVGGETTHSAFGLPTGVVTDDDLKKSSRRFSELFYDNTVKRIVVDEWSMNRIDSFELIDYRLRKVKQVDKPFGGIQMILVADLYQLPPIVSYNEKKHFNKKYLSPWAFTSKVFKKGGFSTTELTKVFRQSNVDQIEALNKIRSKEQGWEGAVDLMNIWGKEPKREVDLVLCAYNDDADIINNREYEAINARERIYKGEVSGNFKQKDTIVPFELRLKEGCRVMISANSNSECEDDYKNGLVGTVVEMFDDHVYVDTDRYGEVKVEMAEFEKFKYSGLGGSLTKITSGKFSQIPLRHGFSVSCHKSQGLTLDSVAINFGERGCFSPAQAYVALSRVRDLNDMYLMTPIKYSDIMVDSKVKRFMGKLKK